MCFKQNCEDRPSAQTLLESVFIMEDIFSETKSDADSSSSRSSIYNADELKSSDSSYCISSSSVLTSESEGINSENTVGERQGNNSQQEQINSYLRNSVQGRRKF